MLTQITAAELKSKLEQTFLNCGDFNIRAVLVKEQTLYLANLGGYTSRDYISENVIKPVIDASPDFIDDSTFLHVLYSSEAAALANFDEVCNRLLAGFAVADIPHPLDDPVGIVFTGVRLSAGGKGKPRSTMAAKNIPR